MKERNDGRVSKVAICEVCNGFIMACHIDHLDKDANKDFTKLSNEGFTVKTETIEQTKARKFTNYDECKAHQP